MKDHPIIFSAPMILALLAGRKTMSRRLAWSERINKHKGFDFPHGHRKNTVVASPWQRVQPGDRLWVKETFVCYHTKEKVYLRGPKIDVEWVHHRASDGHIFVDEMKWESSMYMPRKLSRLTLIVTETKIERLQEISDDDCKREGIQRKKIIVSGEEHDAYSTDFSDGANDSYRGAFEHLWVSLHGLGGWKQNPEVIALSFTVHKQNIDALAKEAA